MRYFFLVVISWFYDSNVCRATGRNLQVWKWTSGACTRFYLQHNLQVQIANTICRDNEPAHPGEHPSVDGKNISYDDFYELGLRAELPEKMVIQEIEQFAKKKNKVHDLVGRSFLDEDFKKQYLGLFESKLARIAYSFNSFKENNLQ